MAVRHRKVVDIIVSERAILDRELGESNNARIIHLVEQGARQEGVNEIEGVSLSGYDHHHRHYIYRVVGWHVVGERKWSKSMRHMRRIERLVKS